MNIDKIITNIIAGKSTKEELDRLQGWRDDASTSVDVLQQITDMSSAADQMQGYTEVDVDAAWAEVDAATSDTASPSSKWIIWTIAAVVVGGLAWYFTKLSPPVQQLHYASVDSAVPVQLPDGSTIVLDQGSTIDIFPDYLDNPIVVLSGRAYFDIIKQVPGATYTVKLDQGEVEVVGTEFSIVDDGRNLEIAVSEGHVIYRLDQRSVDLLAGDKANLIGKTIAKTTVDRANYFSWHTNEIVFKDVSLVQAITDLEWHYDTPIEVLDEVSVTDCKISATYTTESLEDVMKEWKLLLNIDYAVSEDGYITITSARCGE